MTCIYLYLITKMSSSTAIHSFKWKISQFFNVVSDFGPQFASLCNILVYWALKTPYQYKRWSILVVSVISLSQISPVFPLNMVTGTVDSKNTTADRLEPLHVQCVIMLWILQQNDAFWEKHEWRRVNMAQTTSPRCVYSTHSGAETLIPCVPLTAELQTKVRQCLQMHWLIKGHL